MGQIFFLPSSRIISVLDWVIVGYISDAPFFKLIKALTKRKQRTACAAYCCNSFLFLFET